MAVWTIWSDKDKDRWMKWLASLPPSIELQIRMNNIQPDKFYQILSPTGRAVKNRYAVIDNIGKDGATLTVKILATKPTKSGSYRLVSKGKSTSITASNLKECDLPKGVEPFDPTKPLSGIQVVPDNGQFGEMVNDLWNKSKGDLITPADKTASQNKLAIHDLLNDQK